MAVTTLHIPDLRARLWCGYWRAGCLIARSASYVSVNTIKSHLRNIDAKLGVTSREQAVGRAREIGVL